MKRHLLYIGLFCFSALGLQSCLDIDDPGDEMGADEVQLDTERYSGASDKINYRKFASEKNYNAIEAGLSQQLQHSLAGQYCMRGGKEGQYPGDHAYQRQYSLGPDNYAQYSVVPHRDFMYGSLTSTYNVSNEFGGGELYSYTEAKNNFVPILNHPLIDSIPEMKAINLLYLSIIAQEATDLSGPLTYFEDKQNLESPETYESVRDIYYNIVDNVDTIVAALNYYEGRPDWYKTKVKALINKYCKTLSMNAKKEPATFVRLANSLKLRMAMNIVKVEPATAKKWAEEAVAAGVIETIDQQQAIYCSQTGTSHPLANISNGWGDTRLCASFESILKSLNHPYINYLYKKNSGKIGDMEAGTDVIGLRAGIKVGLGQSNPPNACVAFSCLDRDFICFAPLYLIKLSEVEFLRAEGALRGWNMGGTAQEFYENGIRHANLEDQMYLETTDYEARLDEYMSLEQAVPFVQKSPLGKFGGDNGEDWPSVTKIGVKWNDADNNETKLEKIITQKYIAVFPNSWIAWTDLRRTGYPKMFPVLNAFDGDGSIEQGQMIRRIPWPTTDPQVKKNIDATGLKALGGENLQATRLWWDVDAPNF